MAVPYTFGTATSSIPLSQLDSNFATVITLGNTAIQLGNTVTTLNNMTLANVTISSGNVTITNVAITTANVTTANITTAVIGTETVTTSTITSANITTANVTTANIITGNIATGNVSTSLTLSYGTANGVTYLNGSKVLTSGSAFVFDGTNVGIGTNTPTALRSTNLEVFNASGASVVVGTASTSISTLRLARKDATDGWDINYNFPVASMLSFNKLGTNAGPLFNIDSAGNVGIGTSSPAALLDINGSSGWAGGTTGNVVNIKGANATVSQGGNLRVLSSTTFGIDLGGSMALGGQYTSGFYLDFAQIAGRKENATDGSAAGYLAFATRGTGNTTERMRISSAGDVGIGTSSPTSTLSVTHSSGGAVDVKGVSTDGARIRLYNNAATTNQFQIGQGYSSGSDNVAYMLNVANAAMFFGTNNTERMRIDSSGNVLVGTTSLNGGIGGITNNLSTMTTRNTGATAGKFWKGPYVDTSNSYYIINDSNVGVYIADGATSWTANSDERLKDIIEPITDAANKVSTLRAVIGKFKTDEEGTRRSFLIAQDVQAVLPEAVTVGTDSMLGVQYTEVIPLLVAAIKEQQALITSLTARIEALESKEIL